MKKNVKTKQKTVVFKKYHVNLTGVLGDGGVGGGPEILLKVFKLRNQVFVSI